MSENFFCGVHPYVRELGDALGLKNVTSLRIEVLEQDDLMTVTATMLATAEQRDEVLELTKNHGIKAS